MASVRTTKDFSKQVANMIRAYYPVTYINTFEYTRTKDKIRAVVKSLSRSYSFFEWNSVDGLNEVILSTNDIKHIPQKEDPEQLLKSILNDVYLDKNEVYILEDFHHFIGEINITVLLRKLAESSRSYHTNIFIVSSAYKLPLELEKYVTVIEMPLPGRFDLEIVLNRVSADLGIQLDNELKKRLIDAALGMTVMEADLAYCLAAVEDKLGNNSPKIVAFEKEQIIKKSGLLDYYHVSEDLSNIGGLDNLKKWLLERKTAFDYKAQQWLLPEPKGLLLIGVPGCGKSLTAKSIASLWNMPLLRLDIGKVFQGEVGSSENNIRKAIQTAEAVAPCVLWIDEIEKGLSGIQSSGATDGGTQARIFSTILTWMQEKEFPVFVIATANDISQLPPELLRKGRFDDMYFVDLPTLDDRKKIFEIHLRKFNQNPANFALEKLAEETRGFNGAEIGEVVKEGMFSAYIENNDDLKLSTKHLMHSIKETVPLSVTMNDQIEFLRKWAAGRAKMASKSSVPEEVNNGNGIVLTKAEKDVKRNFELT